MVSGVDICIIKSGAPPVKLLFFIVFFVVALDVVAAVVVVCLFFSQRQHVQQFEASVKGFSHLSD